MSLIRLFVRFQHIATATCPFVRPLKNLATATCSQLIATATCYYYRLLWLWVVQKVSTQHSEHSNAKNILEKVSDDGDDIFEKVSDDAKDILEKVSDDCDDIFEKVSDDAKDILEKVSDDGNDIFEKVSDDAKDILVLTMKH